MKWSLVPVTLLASAFSTMLCSSAVLPGIPKPTFEHHVDLEPGTNAALGVVYLVLPGAHNQQRSGPLLTIANPAGNLTADQRAAIIADRASKATQADPTWFHDLTYQFIGYNRKFKHREYVLTSPYFKDKASPEPFVTLDAEYLASIERQYGSSSDEWAAKVLWLSVYKQLNQRPPTRKPAAKDLLEVHLQSAVDHLNLGTSVYNDYLKLGHDKEDLRSAISEYEQSLQENPCQEHALTLLIATLKIHGEDTKAGMYEARLAALKKALPEIEAGNDTANQALEDPSQWAQAIAHYKAARSLYPDCISCHLLLADAYEATKDVAGEKDTLEQIPANAFELSNSGFHDFVTARLAALNKTVTAP